MSNLTKLYYCFDLFDIYFLSSLLTADERTWDAFVSYKSSQVDEDFVLNTIYPKLEHELGFTLCLHFRDFVPGEGE